MKRAVPPKATYKLFGFEVSKSKGQGKFDEFIKEADKVNVYS